MPIVNSRRKTRESSIITGCSLSATFGIASFRAGAWPVNHTGAGLEDPSVSLIMYLVQMVALIALMALDRKMSYARSTVFSIISAAAGVGAAASLLIALFEGPITYVAYAVHACVSAIALLGWGYVLCSLDPRQSAFSIALSFALYGALVLGVSSLPSPWMLTVLVCAYPLTFMCLYAALSEIDYGRERPEEEDGAALKAFPKTLMAVLVLCTIISVFTKAIVPMNEALLASSYQFLWPLVLFVIFLCYCVWLFPMKRTNPQELWPLFIVIILSGLICYAAFAQSNPDFATSFFRATKECLMEFCWIIVAVFAYGRKANPISVFGMFTLIILSGPTFASSVIDFLAPQREAAASVEAVGAATLLSLCLVVAAFVAINASSREKTSGTIPQNQNPEDVEANADPTALLAKLGLTQREIEVASYLLKGYTLPAIAETLQISLDTVRSHTKSIYKKADVHKKQEFISEIEALERTEHDTDR